MLGLTGVGGGSLMTPLLILVFGQSPTVAVGTDLVFAATTKLVATASFGYSRRIDWAIVRRLALGSLPGAAAVLVWFFAKGSSPQVEHTISVWLAVMVGGTALGLLLQHSLTALGLRFTAGSIDAVERFKPLMTVVMGAGLGLAVTLTSVGAGALGVVALLWLYPLRLTPNRLAATDIAHALPLTIVGGLGHAALGHVNLTGLGWLLAGSIPGVLLASRASIHLPAIVTRGLISLMLLLAATRIFLSSG